MKIRVQKVFLICFIGILPLQITIPPQDSTETNWQIAGGMGQYAHIIRGCEGNVIEKEKIPFAEIGASVDHKTKSPIRYGLCFNYIATKEGREVRDYYDEYYGYYSGYSGSNQSLGIFTANPFVNAEWKYFALGAGYVVSNGLRFEAGDDPEHHFPSAYLRIGNARLVYLDASIFHTIPLYSGGLFRMGLGVHPTPKFSYWIGICGVPYDKTSALIKTDFIIQPNLTMNTLVRIGRSEGIPEAAVSLGLTYRVVAGFIMPVTP